MQVNELLAICSKTLVFKDQPTDHHIARGLVSFKLLSHSLLQKRQEHFPPKAFFEESSSWVCVHIVLLVTKLGNGMPQRTTVNGETKHRPCLFSNILLDEFY